MEFVLYSAFFALICLDKKQAFQLAISQPLITSAFIGFFFDAYVPAMYFGLILQLLWLGNLPFGASKTPEGNIASVIGCWLFVEFYNMYEMQGHFLLLLLFMYTVLISFVASKAEVFMRNLNIYFFDYTYNSVSDNDYPGIGKVIFIALGLQFLANWILIIAALILGQTILNSIVTFLSKDLIEIWQFVEIAIWAAGIGLVISVYKDMKLKKIIAGVSVLALIAFKII